MDVPSQEGKEGYIAEFAKLISGGECATGELVAKRGNWFGRKLEKEGQDAFEKVFQNTDEGVGKTEQTSEEETSEEQSMC